MPDVKEQVNSVGRTLAEHDIVFQHVSDFEKPMIVLSFGGGDYSYTHVVIHLIFDEDGESAQVQTSPIANVPVEKTSKMLLTLNECNHKFRWVKFYLDEDNDIIADADVIFDEQNVGEACLEIIMRTASIIDDAYPDLMKGIWG